MSISDYLVAGLDQPDFDLRVASVLGFLNDERQRLEWFDNHRKARCVIEAATQAGCVLDIEQKRGIVAAITGIAEDPKEKKSLGIDTRDYRIAAFVLTHILWKAPKGTLEAAITAFTTGDGQRASVPDASKRTIERVWQQYCHVAHLAVVFTYHRDALRSDPLGTLGWAESLRIAGENYQPPHAAAPLLDPANTVKMPASLGLRIVPVDSSSFNAVTFDP